MKTTFIADFDEDNSKEQIALIERAERTETSWLIRVILLCCVVFLCSLTLADPDLWGHTLYGLRSMEQGVLTETSDPFSYTEPNTSWVNHEWLSEYQFGFLWKYFGNIGLSMWRNIFVMIVLSIAAIRIRQQQASLGAAALLLVFSTECLADFMVFVRPQMTTFALFAVFLAVLRNYWEHAKGYWIWLLPALMVLWVNLHGGFLAGLGIYFVFVAGSSVVAFTDQEQRKRCGVYWVTFLLSMAATFVNPFGLSMHIMLWQHLWDDQFVREWQALWEVRQSPVYYVPFLLIGISLISRRHRWIDLAILAVVGYQAVSHIRHTALLAIATLILLPGPLSDALSRVFRSISFQWSKPSYRWLRVSAVGCLALYLMWIQVRGSQTLWRTGIRPFDVAVETNSDVPGMPLRAIGFMQQKGLNGNIVTDYGWAQCVLWHLFPQSKVAFDGRYRTVYSEKLEQEFLEFHTATSKSPRRLAILDDYPTEIALIPTRQEGLIAYLQSRNDWGLIYQDDQASLFVAKSPKFLSLIEDAEQKGLSNVVVRKWQRFPGMPSDGTVVANSITGITQTSSSDSVAQQ